MKKIFKPIMVLFLLVSLSACSTDEQALEPEEDETEEVEVTEKEVEKPKPKPKPTKSAPKEKVEKVEEPEEEEYEIEEEISEEDARQLRMYLALAMMENNFEGVAEIDYIESDDAITIKPTDDDFVMALAFLQTGDLPMSEWYTLRDNFADMSYQIMEMVGEGVIIQMLNPANPDNTILTVMDGVVLYDAFD